MNDLEEKVNAALSQTLPDDLYDRIEARLSETTDWPDADFSERRTGLSIRRYLSAMAACLALVIGLACGTYYLDMMAVDTVVDIDVNPSIELSVNRRNQILDATSLNEDADAVLDGIILKNADLTLAVNAIVGSMVQKGYLTPGQDNSILVSVRNESAQRAETIRKVVLSGIDGSLSTNQVNAEVLNQTLSYDSQAQQFASTQHISLGKAVLVLHLARKDDTLQPEKLVQMSIRELEGIVRERHLDISDIVDYDKDDSIRENLEESVEEVNEKNAAITEDLISLDAARNAALKHSCITAGQVSHLRVELDREDGVWIYEVEFICGNREFEYEIDARTGRVTDYDVEALNKSK